MSFPTNHIGLGIALITTAALIACSEDAGDSASPVPEDTAQAQQEELSVPDFDAFLLSFQDMFCQAADLCGWLESLGSSYMDCLDMDLDIASSFAGDCEAYNEAQGVSCIEGYVELLDTWEADSCPEDWMAIAPEACDSVCDWGE